MQTTKTLGTIVVAALGCVTAWAATVNVTQPVQVTSDAYYERGQAIVFDGTDYWLFYGRSDAVTDSYATGNPDTNDYKTYYKKAATVAGLPAATAALVVGANNQNGYMGETGAAYFGAEVWAFASIDIGAQADVYGWYTTDGSSWTEVGPMATGLSDGSAHHDEIEYNGELFMVLRRGNFYTTHTATPKTGGWSAEVQVNTGADAGGGLCHFFKDGGNLYLAVLRSGAPRANMIFEYQSGTDSWTKIVEAASSGWDPTLFKVGSDYVFAQAPWESTPNGGRQYIIAWNSDTLDSTFFDGGSQMVVAGQYGDNPWVDMWPIGFTDNNGDSYLFYTSERDTPTAEGAGNIWLLEVDWNLDEGHYTYIQEAIDGVVGSTVNVSSGTYGEQIRFTKSVTVSGGSRTGVVIDPAGASFEGPKTGVDTVRAAVTFEAGSGGSVLEYVTIQNDYASDLNSNAGIEVVAGGIDNITVRYVTVDGVSGHAFGTYDTDHTWPPPAGWTVEHCEFSTSATDTWSGMRPQNMHDLTISYCEVGPTNYGGILLMNCSATAGTGATTVQYCDVHDTVRAGIQIDSYCTGAVDILDNEVWATNSAEAADYGDVRLYGQFTPDPHGDPAAAVTIDGNVLHDGYNGVCVRSGEDISTRTVTVSGNVVFGHSNYGVLNAGTGTLDAEDNWWGDVSGPYDAAGTTEVPPCTGDPATELNADGLGVEVSDGVDYCSWLTDYARLALEADQTCYDAGDTVTIDLYMRGVAETIAGGQFFMAYDTTRLTFVSMSVAGEPFDYEVLNSVDTDAGTLDFAALDDEGTGGTGDVQFAVITFTAVGQICSEQELVTWREHAPPTRLGELGTGVDIYPILLDADIVDDAAPSVTIPDTQVECLVLVPAAATTYAELVAQGGTASDDCTAGDDLLITSVDGALVGDECGGTITRTYTVTDSCGNATDVDQTITVNDTTDPAATAPTNVTVECEGDVPAGVTTHAAYLALGGTASDNCSADIDLTIEFSDGVLTGGACGGTVTRTYTITDECGNDTAVDQIITVDDTIAPTAAAPAGTTHECAADIPAGVTTYDDLVTAGGSASDNCSAGVDLTVGFADGALTGGGCGGTITRTYTITDECGNSVDVDQVFTINDTTNPVATSPTTATIECAADIPAGMTTHAEFVAAGGTASDNCSADGDIIFTSIDGPLTGGGCGGTITRTYTIADACGNFVEVDQVFTVDDITDPTAGAPTPISVQCEGDVPLGMTTYAEFIAAGGTASDNCTVGDNLGFSSVDAPLASGACGGTVTQTYTITDECGNSADVDHIITVSDTTDPTFDIPADITQNADVGVCILTLTTPELDATNFADNCTDAGSLVVGWVRSDTETTLDAVFDLADSPITITWTVTDECGNDAVSVQTITVSPYNSFTVDIHLPGDFGFTVGTFERCMTFELFECPGETATATFSEAIVFSDTGVANGVAIDDLLDCGVYTCIRVRDELHSLWEVGTISIAGNGYAADFTGTDKPVLGNLTGDEWVDVLDFAVLVTRMGTGWTIDTPCGYSDPSGFHPDFDGNGDVDTVDFTYIQTSFLIGDESCCGAARDAGEARSAISVAELYELGMGELAAADLTGDGWVDTDDIVAYLEGATPPAVLPGDLNADGVIDFDDIDAFVLAVGGRDGYQEAYPEGRWLNGDIDGDGLVTFNDIDEFVALLGGN